jgi:hypothetical protein
MRMTRKVQLIFLAVLVVSGALNVLGMEVEA